MLTAETIRQLLDYNPATGEFTWKDNGLPASRSSAIYDRITILGERYYSHRIVWLYVTGDWPAEQIDHINCNKKDNRFSNLREATQMQNSGNMRATKRNKYGLKGVTFHHRVGKYFAQINALGERKYLGYFDTPEAAHDAYVEAAKKYHGEFARVA
jgi:hypothetical protein